MHLEFQLPAEHVRDYRVSFHVGVWTRELKARAVERPQPPAQIKRWLAIQEEFRAAHNEASCQESNAPFILDNEGNPIKDENGDLIWREDFGEGITGSGQLADKIRQEWKPRLAALWQEWREENSKPGVAEALGRYYERCQRYEDWIAQRQPPPPSLALKLRWGAGCY